MEPGEDVEVRAARHDIERTRAEMTSTAVPTTFQASVAYSRHRPRRMRWSRDMGS
jgi:hypothetical protein